jgi:hypothetical protein
MNIENALKNKSDLTDDQKLAYLEGVWPLLTADKHKNILIKFIEERSSSHDIATLKQILSANDYIDSFHLSNEQKNQISAFADKYQSRLVELFTVNQIHGKILFTSTEDELIGYVSDYVFDESEFEYELINHLGLLDELEIDDENIFFDCDKNEDIDYLRDIQHDIKDDVVKAIMSFNEQGRIQ